MNKYRIFIEGKNFLIEFDDKPKNMGFFTTRYVEAIDHAEAENKAIELIKNDSKIIIGDRPRFCVCHFSHIV